MTCDYTGSLAVASGQSLPPVTVDADTEAVGTLVFSASMTDTADGATAAGGTASLDVTALTQTIDFSPPTSGVVGDQPTLTATGGGSGNPVVFTVDASSTAGACTIAGAVVTYTGAGNCVVDANQAGNATYAAAPQVQGTIVVSSGIGTQTIDFTPPASGVVGGHATLTATGGGSGNPVVFTVDASSTAGACTIAGAVVTYTGAGNCVVDANQAGNGEYAAAPEVQGTIVVDTGTQTIDFTPPASGVVGRRATLTATGGGSGNPVVFTVDASSTAGACTIAGAVVTYTGAGNCVVDANQAGNGEYAAAPRSRARSWWTRSPRPSTSPRPPAESWAGTRPSRRRAADRATRSCSRWTPPRPPGRARSSVPW